MLTADVKRKAKQAEYYQKNKERARLNGARWKKANPDKIRLKNRKLQLKTQYGLEWDTFVELFNKAEGKCEICHKPLQLAGAKEDVIESASVDHCHTTGKVRGLLCRSCNVALGHFKDSRLHLENALAYLDKNDAFR